MSDALAEKLPVTVFTSLEVMISANEVLEYIRSLADDCQMVLGLEGFE